MKQFSKIICLALVLVMMLSTTAFAASIGTPDVDEDKENRNVTVTATVTDPVTNQQVTILVIPQGKSLSSFSDEDVVYVDQIAATNGTASFPFNVAEDKGDRFVAYVGGTNVAQVGKASINLGMAGPGDVNGNGVVDLSDYMALLSSFGSKPGDAKWNENADFNGNGEVDLPDYMAVLQYWTK